MPSNIPANAGDAAARDARDAAPAVSAARRFTTGDAASTTTDRTSSTFDDDDSDRARATAAARRGAELATRAAATDLSPSAEDDAREDAISFVPTCVEVCAVDLSAREARHDTSAPRIQRGEKIHQEIAASCPADCLS
jgi:hypothetical protein